MIFAAGRRGLLFLLLGLVVLGVVGLLVWSYLTRPVLTAEEKGRRLAEQTGCFGCHGPSGTGGVFNPGRADVMVPNWKGDMMMFAKDTAEIRQWIADGATTAKSHSDSWREQRAKGALKMPAFGRRLSSDEINDLVAFVATVNVPSVPEDSLALSGYYRADSLACFGCHGSGGRYARPNPGSFKGYVASWETSDFADLVMNRQEFDEWVNDGISKRLDGNSVAKYFLRHAELKMPKFRSHLQAGDLDAVWAYISWLRADSTSVSRY